ncbi:MAG: helix-turn-helix transcriptional regulator [Candidatus Marinimicrobia bacterium]|nr:helix-turn-helix transcriptional regulator [Candidatus Neomarinimicrobiota bacterium]
MHLLGILYYQDVHGYQLNQALKQPGNVINIGKANAYKLLATLEDEGFVSHIEERSGNRPSRMVYSISETGKSEFMRLLRESLAHFQPIEYAGGISLNYINLLKPQEALSLLQQRQVHLADHCKVLNDFSDELRASHPGIDFLVRHAALEQEFLIKLVEEYQHKQKDDNNGEKTD